jgi:hypothetical protein
MSQPRRANESQRKQIYRKLDFVTLLNILLDNPDKPSLQREALDQLRTLPPDTRSQSLIQSLKGMVHYHTRNDVGVLTDIVDLLATDPNPEATRAMLDVLPIVAKSVDEPQTSLTPEFREYYYQALLTRRRAADRALWAECLPKLDGETLVDIITDPAAAPLAEAIVPMRWINRLPRRERRQTLTNLVVGPDAKLGIKALGMLVGVKGSESP